jgi:hypothetical protein
MNRVKLSKMIEKGLDLSMSEVNTAEEGVLQASTDKWQLAMQYAILQELKGMNGNIRALVCRYDTMRKELQRIDRRLATQIKLPKGRTKK